MTFYYYFSVWLRWLGSQWEDGTPHCWGNRWRLTGQHACDTHHRRPVHYYSQVCTRGHAYTHSIHISVVLYLHTALEPFLGRLLERLKSALEACLFGQHTLTLAAQMVSANTKLACRLIITQSVWWETHCLVEKVWGGRSIRFPSNGYMYSGLLHDQQLWFCPFFFFFVISLSHMHTASQES